MEQARLEYSKTDNRYNIVLQMYKDVPNTTSVPLNTDMLVSLIKLFSNEGKIQKALNNMIRKTNGSR